jgi:competence protein CoiA
MWHWAHKGRLLCDPWWENETEWHRAWKDQFPADWQEIVHHSGDGERHIADVKTGDGWVIEFQHSHIEPDERRSREAFYPKLIWVIDGTRRKRDESQFLNAFNDGLPVGAFRRAFSDRCVLLREWGGSNAPILLDFGGEALWWLVARSTDGSMYVLPYSRARFMESHRGGAPEAAQDFDKFVNGTPKLIADCESLLQAQPLRWGPMQPLGFPRRFRF